MSTRTSTALRRAATGLLALALLGTGMAATTSAAFAADERTYQVKTTLDGRTVKDPDVPVGSKQIADMYEAGSPVTLVCQDRGPSYGGSDIWDLTDDGLWIPDAYVDTDSTGMVMARCAVPKSYPAKTDLNGRKKKGEAATAPGAVVDKYREGQSVPVDCQALSGGAIWDHTTDDLWVPDEYVKTGITGFVQGLPRCDGDDRNTTTHVALYLGDEQILEAAPPRDGSSVHVRGFYGRSSWTAHAVRYITGSDRNRPGTPGPPDGG